MVKLTGFCVCIKASEMFVMDNYGMFVFFDALV